MSGSFVALALIIAVMTVFMSVVYANYGKCIMPIASIGSILVISAFVLSMCFCNFKHMIACMKYDHVVSVEWNLKTQCPMQIDESKIIYVNDSTSANASIMYRCVIMAWNDQDEYAKLTKEK